MAKESVVRQVAKAALDAQMDGELSGEAAEAVIRVASLVLDAGTAEPL